MPGAMTVDLGRRTGLLAVTSAVIIASCGGGGSGSGADALSGRDARRDTGGGIIIIGADVTPDAVEDAATPDAFSCVPNQRTCVTPTSWAICTKTGTGHGLESDCAGQALCEPQSGLCKLPFCVPESRKCAGISTFQVCNASGTDFDEELRHCADGQVCVDGQCRACFPGRLSCADDTTPAICAEDGETFVPQSPCPSGQACYEFNGECRPPVCVPGAPSCASLTSYHHCLPSGTGYDSLVQGCFDGSLCKDSQCVLASCVPLVMLLVDRSGSMVPHWPAVRASVKSVIAQNPQAAFGIMAFPADGGCGAPNYPSLPLNYQDEETIDAWFDATMPNGATPLAYSMRGTALVAESIWGASGGALVVLSDGEDTCVPGGGPTQDDAVTLISSWARVLFEQHGVRSYAIGYKFEGDTSQLDAIAANGGTETTSYLAAGSEAELANAFKTVIADYKWCLPPKN